MRVLTIRQPWASAVIAGRKPVENRSWETSYRGDVAIHAATKTDNARAFDLCGRDLPHVDTLGAILGVAELFDVVTANDPRVFDIHVARWFTGPYGLMLRDVRPLRSPIPFRRGQLRMFAAPAELETQIKEQLP